MNILWIRTHRVLRTRRSTLKKSHNKHSKRENTMNTLNKGSESEILFTSHPSSMNCLRRNRHTQQSIGPLCRTSTLPEILGKVWLLCNEQYSTESCSDHSALNRIFCICPRVFRVTVSSRTLVRSLSSRFWGHTGGSPAPCRRVIWAGTWWVSRGGSEGER